MKNPFAFLNTQTARARRIFWSASIVGVVLLIYVGVGIFALPSIVRSQLTQFVAQQYHRQLTLGKISFNPFTLTLDVHDVSLPDQDTQAMLACKELSVDLQLSSIWRRGLSFGDIFLTEPYARVAIRSDGSLNLAELSLPPSEPDTHKATSPLRVFIDHLKIVDGRVAYQDQHRTTPFAAVLQPINFDLREFSTTANSDNEFNLQAQSSAGEQLSWSGTFSMTPLASSGKYAIAHLHVSTLRNYLSDLVNFDTPSGEIALNGDYAWSSATQSDIKLNVAQLKIDNLRLTPRGTPQEYLQLKQFSVADLQLDSAKHSVTVKSTTLDGGNIHAWLDAHSQLNLLQLAQTLVTPSSSTSTTITTTAAATPPPETPWTIAISEIAAHAVHIDAEDRHITPHAAIAVDPLDLSIKNFTTAPGGHAIADLSATLNATGQVHANATIDLDNNAISGAVQIHDVNLVVLQPYLAQHTSMTLLSGALNAKLAITQDTEHGLHVTGDSEVTHLHTVDNELKEDFINWRALSLQKIDYHSKPRSADSLRIAAIDVSSPYARVIVDSKQKTNISLVLQPSANEVASTATRDTLVKEAVDTDGKQSPPQSMALSIGVIRIKDGAVNYADYWIEPNFATAIQSVEGSIKNLSSAPNSRAIVKIDGQVDKYSPVHISGEINPLSAAAYGDIKMDFQNLDLPAVTPYSGHFAGYKIEKGKLSATMEYHIENRQLQASHHIVIDALQLGDKVESADAVSLPLKLAVALLKDSNGVIDLQLPVTGSLDDPKFSVGPIVWQVFKTLITKAATAPFRLLANLFGGSEDMNLIDFKPGDATLDSAALAKLQTLSKALHERQQLRLDVPLVHSDEIDRTALAQQKLQAKLLALKHSDASALADPLEHFRLSVVLFRQSAGANAPLPPSALAAETALSSKPSKDSPPIDVAAATAELNKVLLATLTTQPSELDALSKARAESIRDTLLANKDIDATRIFIVTAPSSPPVNGAVQAQLTLK